MFIFQTRKLEFSHFVANYGHVIKNTKFKLNISMPARLKITKTCCVNALLLLLA